jgi:YD repeat-containing protein
MDAFGRVVKQTRSAGGGSGETTSIAQAYDVAGNLTGITDGNGHLKNRQYDYAGRVIKETQAITATLVGWQTVTHTLERRYAYDATGRQTATLSVYMQAGVAQQTGQRSVYNAFGQVTEEQQVWGWPVRH